MIKPNLIGIGLGLAIARFVVNAGHNVVITARSQSALEAFQAEMPAQIRSIAGDITDPTLAKHIADCAESTFGSIDGLVINQGIMEPVERIANSKAEGWRKCFDINLFSAISLVSIQFRLSMSVTKTSSKQLCQHCANRKERLSSHPQERLVILTLRGAHMAPPRPL